MQFLLHSTKSFTFLTNVGSKEDNMNKSEMWLWHYRNLSAADCTGFLKYCIPKWKHKVEWEWCANCKISNTYAYTVLKINKLPCLYSTARGLTANNFCVCVLLWRKHFLTHKWLTFNGKSVESQCWLRFGKPRVILWRWTWKHMWIHVCEYVK